MAEAYEFIYSAEGGSAWVTGVKGDVPETLVIPDTLDGCEVTALGLYAHRFEREDYDERRGEIFVRKDVETKTCALTGMEGVKHLRLPRTVRQMSKEALERMDALRKVTVSSRFFAVEDGCLFDFTGALYGVFTEEREVLVPEKVERLLPRAFRFSPSVEKVVFSRLVYPEDNRFVRGGPFTGSNVREVVFPEGVTTLGAFFKDYGGIDRLTVPASVKNLSGLFDGCRSLREITVKDGLTTIGSRSFSGCTALASIRLPSTLRAVGDEAFSGSGLLSIVLPESVTEIGKNVFKYCGELKEAVLPKNATLGWEAFRYCKSLERVTLPETLTQIPSYTFEKCTSLAEIVIPDGVRSICDKAFAGCTSLKSVWLPKSLRSLGDRAFWGCEALESLVLPKSIEWIYECALFDVQRVFYEGSVEEFKRVNKSFGNGRAIFFYAETAPETAGKHWHYVDGEPTIWE